MQGVSIFEKDDNDVILKEYKIVKELGFGSFGRVYLVVIESQTNQNELDSSSLKEE